MEIKEQLIQKYNITTIDWNNTIDRTVTETMPANKSFLSQGKVSNKIGFVKSGILRAFFNDEDGNEITTHFFQQDSVVISVDSFRNQIPANESIVAVDDCELIIISYQKLQELYLAVPIWQQICMDIAESKNLDLVARSVQFQTQSANERYHLFCQQYPNVIKKVALCHIASYLGINIATLSRIRKKNCFI